MNCIPIRMFGGVYTKKVKKLELKKINFYTIYIYSI